METSKLADRLRGIVQQSGRRAPAVDVGPTAPVPDAARVVESVLGGEWRDEGGHRRFVVERRIDPDERHGSVRVGDLAECCARHAAQASMLTAGAPARLPFMFFDLETTGLSGGAGTYAFLVGFGSFDASGAFVTRQFVMTAPSDERPLLEAVSRDVAGAGALVSFNGRSFDAPVLETRYLFHRLEWPGSRVPHLDALYPARRFWSGDEGTSCSLVTLERQILGVGRAGDVPGFEIPARYFQFVRSGDARPLAAVLEHNRLDLLSLAGLTARLLQLLADGPRSACDAREALALGRIYARSGLDGRARESFTCVLVMDASARMRGESLRSLACEARRSRRFDEAAAYWREVLDTPGCAPHVSREANEALAIHHEHRARDLAAAKTFALRSLETCSRPVWNEAVRHRLARLQRKMERREGPGLLAYQD